MNDNEHIKWAKILLAYLVKHVIDFPGGDKFLTYGDLADKVNYPQPHTGNLFGKNIGTTLGVMGHLLDNILIPGWKGTIPLIQSVVVNSNTKLPSDGLKEFSEIYPSLTQRKKKDFVNNEYEKIFNFGNLWINVLNQLKIKPLDDIDTEKNKNHFNPYGSEGSPEHRKLRDFIANNPKTIGIDFNKQGIVEYPLKSGDSIDVVFEDEQRIIGIEVKSIRSGNDDIERGLYQTVKYSSVLKAESIINNDNKLINCILVVEGNLSAKLLKIKKKLKITVHENIKPK